MLSQMQQHVFCHSQIKLLDTHHHTWSVSSTWLQGGGSGDTQSMSGGTNEPQHRLLFPNNSPQPSSLISHHPNTHMSNPPLHPLTHSHPTPQSSPTESADAHCTQHTQHIHRISIHTHTHTHTEYTQNRHIHTECAFLSNPLRLSIWARSKNVRKYLN